MGSCVSSSQKHPDSVINFTHPLTSKTHNSHIPSPVKHKSFSTAHPPLTHPGSKEEAFFDSNVWLDSDCEDDFMSVNGEFTPSRGNTPVHHNFTAGAPQVNKIVVTDLTPDAIHEPSPTDKKLRLCDLFEDSFRGDPNVDEQHTSAEMPCASSVQSSERTPSGSFKAKSLRSIQCCLPSLRSSNSFSERKMKASPVHSVA